MNGYLDKLRKEYRRGYIDSSRFYRQVMCDLAVLVLAQDFRFTPDRLMKFCESLGNLHDEYADIFNADSKDMEYSKAKMDEALWQVCGDLFIPWEERYK